MAMYLHTVVAVSLLFLFMASCIAGSRDPCPVGHVCEKMHLSGVGEVFEDDDETTSFLQTYMVVKSKDGVQASVAGSPMKDVPFNFEVPENMVGKSDIDDVVSF